MTWDVRILREVLKKKRWHKYLEANRKEQWALTFAGSGL
jgi:hypothetical protein